MIGITGTVVILLALIVVLLKDPDRRYRIIYLFRRGDASVHYSRVSVPSKLVLQFRAIFRAQFQKD